MQPYPIARPAPSLDAPCTYLDEVLASQAADGGPLLGSPELEDAARRLARAWARAELPERALRAWMALAATAAFGEAAGVAALTRRLQGWAVEECLSVAVAAVLAPASAA